VARRRRIPRVLLLIDTAGAYGRGVVEGIGRYALEHGPWSIQFEYRALDSSPPEWLDRWSGDGIITRTSDATQAGSLLATKRPLVELFGCPKVLDWQVRPDLAAEASMVVEHFVDCGLRCFGYFSYEEVWWTRVHREAFVKAVEARGHECHSFRAPKSKRAMPIWRDGQRPRLLRWLHGLPRHIGIYTPGDLHAVRVLDGCHEAGISVPDDVAVLGRGNDPVICETVRPTMSSLDPDARRVGYEAAKLLAQKMAGKAAPEAILIPPSGVAARQSTDFTVVDDADVAQAVRFVRQKACLGIDVPRVAREVGLSRRLLEIKFRQHLGRSPKAEIRRVQMEHAKRLLARSEKTVDAIAHACGHVSAKYFAAAFIREIGLSPTAYRKAHRFSRDSGKQGS
jgi:LacI family transcriptional regulator